MKSRRKIRYIDPVFQGALTFRIVLYGFIYACLAMAVLTICQVLTDLKPNVSILAQLQTKYLELAPAFILAVAMLPIIAYDLICFTHRFAGPLYRLRKSMGQLAAGEQCDPIRLRKGDAFTDLADTFNAILHRIENLTQEARSDRQILADTGFQNEFEVLPTNGQEQKLHG